MERYTAESMRRKERLLTGVKRLTPPRYFSLIRLDTT